MDSKLKLCNKKPYQKPALTVFGDVHILTQSNSMTAANADGGMGNTKT